MHYVERALISMRRYVDVSLLPPSLSPRSLSLSLASLSFSTNLGAQYRSSESSYTKSYELSAVKNVWMSDHSMPGSGERTSIGAPRVSHTVAEGLGNNRTQCHVSVSCTTQKLCDILPTGNVDHTSK